MQNPPACLATKTTYFAPSPTAQSAHWSVLISGLIAESGVDRSSYSRSCQVFGAMCTIMPISRSCQAFCSGVGSARERSEEDTEVAKSHWRGLNNGAARLVPNNEATKRRRFIISEFLKSENPGPINMQVLPIA